MTSEGVPFLEEGLECVCVDSTDPSALAAWWQGLIGGEVHIDTDGDVTLRAGGVRLLFLGVPEPKEGKNRLHVDLRATDFESAVEAALALGAQRADDVYDGIRWQVLRDPEGNEFCILRPRQNGESEISAGDPPSPTQS